MVPSPHRWASAAFCINLPADPGIAPPTTANGGIAAALGARSAGAFSERYKTSDRAYRWGEHIASIIASGARLAGARAFLRRVLGSCLANLQRV